MLFAIDGDEVKRINHIPHRQEFDAWMANLAPEGYDGVVEALSNIFDESEIQTSSFIPGDDWTGTPYEPIWHAVGHDMDRAALFFGLIVWRVVMEHPESWSFGRYFDHIQGMTYFRIAEPDA